MVKLECFWCSNKDWYEIKNGARIIKEDAPKEAKESYLKYLKQLEDIDNRTSRTFVIPKTKDGIKWYEENDLDWERGTYETKDIVVYNIPYNEFCILREIEGIEDLIDEYESKRLPLESVQEQISIIEEQTTRLVKVIEVLNTAVKCGTFVDFVEAHIL